MKIAVVDGLGGGLGSQIVEGLKQLLVDSVEIIALGTNSQATSNMLERGASRGATGENAICYTVRGVDIIIGPIGIIIPNSMSGEITTTMAEAIVNSPAERILLGIKQSHVRIVGMKDISLNQLFKELKEELKDLLDACYIKQ
ncbi:MAG: DUF3842 family protein [Halanaerobiaceae bacterium]|nr:DUF3842 family protein [Halanaerobiaceae bacterium]